MTPNFRTVPQVLYAAKIIIANVFDNNTVISVTDRAPFFRFKLSELISNRNILSQFART